MESALHEVLKNLCYKYNWSSGTFWRYNEDNPLLLTLKDFYFNDEAKVFADDGMFRKVHVVGDGLVGQVAFSGMHGWVSSDTHLEEYSFRLGCYKNVFQVSSDVQRHFLTGIKTVAVVPLEPHGIAQFGSFEKILESTQFLDETKRLFGEIETVNESINQQPESLKMDLLDPLLSPTSWNHQPALHKNQPQLELEQLCFSPKLPIMQSPIQHNAEPDKDIALGSDNLEILATLLEDQEEISIHQIFENCCSFNDNSATDQHQGSENTADHTFWECEDFLNQDFRHGQIYESRAVSTLPGAVPGYNYNIDQRPASSHWQDLLLFNQVFTAGSRVGNLTSACEFEKGSARKMPDYSTLLSNGISSQRLRYDADWTTLGRSWMRHATKNSLLDYKPSKEGVTRIAKVLKKKAKSSEARHRPKDRELQPKFYAQLRSLVPDGQKCTQDGLLTRTIKHIGFLQKVSKDADKLKHGYHPMLLGLKNELTRAAETPENPINVEALSPPGSYVIEMIWDARPLFFDTVDRLRGQGLNILKGMMEYVENKMWVCFIVETVGQISKANIHVLVKKILHELDRNVSQLNPQLDVYDSY